MYYLIKNTLQVCSLEECMKGDYQFVAVLSPNQWLVQKDKFDMGIDQDLDLNMGVDEVHNTKADINYDSITGSFCIPDRSNLDEDHKFIFAMDEKGIVFVDKSGTVRELISGIRRTKRWKQPSLERFLYDFLERIIAGDTHLLNNYEKELDGIEDQIQDGREEGTMERINEIRGDLLNLRSHYEQLIDLGQIFEENESSFFKEENVRYFNLFIHRVDRRLDTVAGLRDYTVQVRDLYQSHLDLRQNRIMTILTVVTTIFMPLTLIAGWYGMNFRYMPELNSRYGYPMVILISIAIAVGSLLYFKKKKWL